MFIILFIYWKIDDRFDFYCSQFRMNRLKIILNDKVVKDLQ
ncbi:hypothetical protein [Macrococcoides caseolyticum]|nr:hypothetical protein [Macrococcus caseolyticus]